VAFAAFSDSTVLSSRPGGEISDIDIGAIGGNDALDVGVGLGAIGVLVLDGIDNVGAGDEGGFVVILGGAGDGVGDALAHEDAGIGDAIRCRRGKTIADGGGQRGHAARRWPFQRDSWKCNMHVDVAADVDLGGVEAVFAGFIEETGIAAPVIEGVGDGFVELGLEVVARGHMPVSASSSARPLMAAEAAGTLL
jgi:hypothetical protein